MIRVEIDCATHRVRDFQLTLAEEEALQLRRAQTQAEDDVRAAREAAVRTARETFAALDPKTVTLEQVVTLLQATRTVAVQAETERTST